MYEFWLDANDNPMWARHYSTHGNSSEHPIVTHDHEWHDDGNGHQTEDTKSLPPNPGFHAPNSDDSNDTSKMVIDVARTVGVAAGGYIIYVGAKWIIASIAAPFTGGGSYAIAGLLP